jgi:hypothetical protein
LFVPFCGLSASVEANPPVETPWQTPIAFRQYYRTLVHMLWRSAMILKAAQFARLGDSPSEAQRAEAVTQANSVLDQYLESARKGEQRAISGMTKVLQQLNQTLCGNRAAASVSRDCPVRERRGSSDLESGVDGRR